MTTPHRTPSVRVCLPTELRELATTHKLNLSALLHEALQDALRALGVHVDVPRAREGRPPLLRVGDAVAWAPCTPAGTRTRFGPAPFVVTAVLPPERVRVRGVVLEGASEVVLRARYLTRVADS